MSISRLADARARAHGQYYGHYDPDGVRQLALPSATDRLALQEALLRAPASARDAQAFIATLAKGLRSTRGLTTWGDLRSIDVMSGRARPLIDRAASGPVLLELLPHPPASYLHELLTQVGIALPAPADTLPPYAGRLDSTRRHPSHAARELMQRTLRMEDALGSSFLLRVLDDMMDIGLTIGGTPASEYVRAEERVMFQILRAEGLRGLATYHPSLLDTEQRQAFVTHAERAAAYLRPEAELSLTRALDRAPSAIPTIRSAALDALVRALPLDRGLYRQERVPDIYDTHWIRWQHIMTQPLTEYGHVDALITVLGEMAPGLRSAFRTRWERGDFELHWVDQPMAGALVIADYARTYLFSDLPGIGLRIARASRGLDVFIHLANILLSASLPPDPALLSISCYVGDSEAGIRHRYVQRLQDRFGHAFAFGLSGLFEFVHEGAQTRCSIALPAWDTPRDFLTRYGIQALRSLWRHFAGAEHVAAIERGIWDWAHSPQLTLSGG